MEQGQRGRVLVVENDKGVGRAIARALAKHDVLVLVSGREALDRVVQGERFDVILYDLMLPELHGMDFQERLASIAPEMVEHVVFLTGGAFTSRAMLFLGFVAVSRIDKPFSLEELRGVVREHVGKARSP